MKEMFLYGDVKEYVSNADFENIKHLKWSISRAGKTAYVVHHRSTRKIRLPKIYLHRMLLNAKKGEIVDHIDGDGLNNTRENLRIISHSENIRKMTKIRNLNSSGYKGVYWATRYGKWEVGIMKNYRKMYLGRFDSKHDAARAYNKAAVQLFGDFASLNVIKVAAA